MGLIVPAVLPASREELDEKLTSFGAVPSIDRIQIDTVDGRFVSPASWPYFAKASQGTPYSAPTELETMVQRGEMFPNLDRIEYEIDFMCRDADYAAEPWLALGATRLTFHTESTKDVPKILASARRQYGPIVSLGLALNVASDLALIEPCLDAIEYVQFMGIARIGRQGQPFDRRVLEKVRVFRTRHPEIPVQVDGGISLDTARELIALGVAQLVVGSALTRTSDLGAAVAAFEALESPYGV